MAVVLRRSFPSMLLLSAAGAWLALVAAGRDMGTMSGTMDLGLVSFVGVWILMMAAMMLPAVAPFASFYSRTFTAHREGRLVMFSLGYLFVWAAAAVPAYALALLVDSLVLGHAPAVTALAVGIFVSCGIYQLTPWKDRCLALCRSPLGFTLRYASYTGSTRDLRVGAAHGAFCLGCCWALMLVLFAFGLMNLVVMLGVAAIVFAEKLSVHGVRVARVVGVVSLVLAVVVIAWPQVASGLYHAGMPMPGSGM